MGRRPITNSLYEQDNTDTEKIRTYRHPCSKWESKPVKQCAPWTAWLLQSAENHF